MKWQRMDGMGELVGWRLLVNEEDRSELIRIIWSTLQDGVQEFHDAVLKIVTHGLKIANCKNPRRNLHNGGGLLRGTKMEKLFLLFLFVCLASYLNHIDGKSPTSFFFSPSL
jgi:hypothetical protein